jgi:5'-nucleotidase
MENKIKIHKTMNTKKFSILHSNDMHGDFLAEVQGGLGNRGQASQFHKI